MIGMVACQEHSFQGDFVGDTQHGHDTSMLGILSHVSGMDLNQLSLSRWWFYSNFWKHIDLKKKKNHK